MIRELGLAAAAIAIGLCGCGGRGGPPATARGPDPSSAGGSATTERATAEETSRPGPQLVTRPSERPVVTFRVVFAAGSGSDPEGREGATHLAATLMAKGGAGGRTYEEITRALYPMAGQIDVEVGRDQTTFIGRVHRDHLDEFYPIFRDVLLDPAMARKDFRRLEDQIRSRLELELRGNDDERLGKEALQAMLYEGHPYGHPAIGTETGLDALSLKHVRAQRRRAFCAARATLGLAGDYPDGLARRVRDDLASLRFDECKPERRPLPPAPSVEQPRVRLIDKGSATSVAVSMGLHVEVTRAHPDYPALLLATAYLGQHRHSIGRLMETMRDQRGLNYGDYAYIEHFDQAGGSPFPEPNIARRQQYFSIWLRPVGLEDAHFAVQMAVRELRRFVEHGLTERELEHVRGFADHYYALYLQTASRRLGFAIDDRFYGLERPWLERLRAAWEELTVDEVNAAIRRHIAPERLQIALVHPDAKTFADRLASGDPAPPAYEAEPSEAIREEDRAIVDYELDLDRDRMNVVPLDHVFR